MIGYMGIQRNRYFLLLLLPLLLFHLQCGKGGDPEGVGPGDVKKTADAVPVDESDFVPVTTASIIGRWSLIYADNYGYSFTFFKNFRALIVIYLKTSAILFKGVYTIEENNSIRVNIVEMKNEESIQNINSGRDFVKTQKSYFIFRGSIREREKKKALIVKPEKIIIDGSNSEGYFEPLIKLEQN